MFANMFACHVREHVTRVDAVLELKGRGYHVEVDVWFIYRAYVNAKLD
jgi:predicted RecB family endonuclease